MLRKGKTKLQVVRTFAINQSCSVCPVALETEQEATGLLDFNDIGIEKKGESRREAQNSQQVLLSRSKYSGVKSMRVQK